MFKKWGGYVLAGTLVFSAAQAASAGVLFSSGDSSQSSLSLNVIVDSPYSWIGHTSKTQIYTAITVPVGQTWTVTGMETVVLDPSNRNATMPMSFDIRSGMVPGTAWNDPNFTRGTVVASGDSVTATSSALGYSITGWAAYDYSIALPSPVELAGGNTYYVSFVPISVNYNQGVALTLGANSVNSTYDNQSIIYLWNYDGSQNLYNVSGDYVLKLTGTLAGVPEPASLAVLSLGAVALLRRRR